MSRFKAGDRVRFVGAALYNHNFLPSYYPQTGTIGVILSVDEDGGCYVQWPRGSTSLDDKWHAAESCLEPVEVPI